MLEHYIIFYRRPC